MSQIGQFRHYATFRREEVIVAGYNRGRNDCLVVRLTMLPVDEQADLRRIASSTIAQSQDTLTMLLMGERHKSGRDWMTHLAERKQRNDGSVMTLPLKELEDMHPEQKAFFKGYGKPVAAPKPVAVQEEAEIPVAALDEVILGTVNGVETTVSTQPATVSTGMSDPALVAVLTRLAEGQEALIREMRKRPSRKTTKGTGKVGRPRKPQVEVAAPHIG